MPRVYRQTEPGAYLPSLGGIHDPDTTRIEPFEEPRVEQSVILPEFLERNAAPEASPLPSYTPPPGIRGKTITYPPGFQTARSSEHLRAIVERNAALEQSRAQSEASRAQTAVAERSLTPVELPGIGRVDPRSLPFVGARASEAGRMRERREAPFTLGPDQLRFKGGGKLLAEGRERVLTPYQQESLSLQKQRLDIQTEEQPNRDLINSVAQRVASFQITISEGIRLVGGTANALLLAEALREMDQPDMALEAEELQSGVGAGGQPASSGESVRVISPDGRRGTIPQEDLDAALREGFTLAE